jgi:hypothetical protein
MLVPDFHHFVRRRSRTFSHPRRLTDKDGGIDTFHNTRPLISFQDLAESLRSSAVKGRFDIPDRMWSVSPADIDRRSVS